MKTVNCYLIMTAFGILEVAEVENGGPLPLDPDDERSMKDAYARHVKPWVDRWAQHRKDELKRSLAYFLQKPEVLENDVLANVQDLTMPEPSDIQKLFLWLYEVLFPDEPPSEVDLSDVVEDNDIMKTNFSPDDWATSEREL